MGFLGSGIISVHVRVLPPYIPKEEEKADANLYARNCHSYMAAELIRVRTELYHESWQRFSGRAHGGLGYRFGDFTNGLIRKAVGEAVGDGEEMVSAQWMWGDANILGTTLAEANPMRWSTKK